MKDKKTINDNVGKRIRELRQARGMTQLDLAQKIGLTSKAAISKIEHGERQVSVLPLRPACAVRYPTMRSRSC